MHNNIVYVLHKQGAPSHYVALDFLAKINGAVVKYREFSVVTKFFKSLRTGDFRLLAKQFTNLGFLLGLLFSKNRKIVLAIAPFDRKLGILLKILKNHEVYYHTSWACWDKGFHPKKKGNSPAVFAVWKFFLEKKAKHIFCVNETGKNQLLENYTIDNTKISVVHHALDRAFSTALTIEKKEKSFIYYGRLVPQKGIEELLVYFSENKELTLTLIGGGKQENIVKRYAEKYGNILYHEQMSNKQALKKELAQHQYLILNSHKNSKWEELFGLVIIESMSQGVVPISAKHPGPKEIISNDTGFLFEEGKLAAVIPRVLSNEHDREQMSANGISESKKYLLENIAQRWKTIL